MYAPPHPELSMDSALRRRRTGNERVVLAALPAEAVPRLSKQRLLLVCLNEHGLGRRVHGLGALVARLGLHEVLRLHQKFSRFLVFFGWLVVLLVVRAIVVLHFAGLQRLLCSIQ